jgi:outer membrane murein-binding lipoprotein Lpp
MQPNDVVSLVLGSLSILALLLGALGWWIKAKIRDATLQIQPNANGGKSLADLHKKVDGITTDVQMLKSAVLQIEDDIEELR